MKLLIALFLVNFFLQQATCLPAGFEDEGFLHVRYMVDIGFTPDEKFMFVVAKLGILYSYELETGEQQEALDISDRVCDNGERGLSTVTFHPEYETNRWIYLFYTFNRGDKKCLLDSTDGPVNRCSRFTVNDDNTMSQDSELVLFQTTPLEEKVHNGGDMEFGVDGMLYVTLGDGGDDDQSIDQGVLHGSILRLTESGGIPNDNPFVGDDSARCAELGKLPSDSDAQLCQEIFSYGFRNPFRFSMDPHSTDKVRYLVSDVGGTKWEEISVGGTDYAGFHYGWPDQEGPCQKNSYDECMSVDGLQDPLFWYEHDPADAGCVNAVVVPPPDLNWPSPYNEKSSFYYVDFVFGEIYHVTTDTSDYCRDCIPPRHGYQQSVFHQWERGVGMKFGPYKTNETALYYTAREGNPNIRRIVYKGGDNYAPTASFSMSESSVPVGGEISFNASQSEDLNHPDEELTYTWRFGDDSDTETGISVSHVYKELGIYTVKMTVTDPDGASAQSKASVSIGDKPTLTITSPAEGTTFAVGEVFTLIGEGIDTSGDPLDDSALSWEVRQHHNEHYHPFQERTKGNNVVITEAPKPEDFLAATNSYLEIRLTGLDSNGLSETISRNIMPKEVYVEFDTVPSGLNLTLDDQEIHTPQRVLSWENHDLEVFAFDQDDYVFSRWADGVATKQKDTINIQPASVKNQTVVAVFEVLMPPATETDAPVAVPALTNSPVANPEPTRTPITIMDAPVEPQDSAAVTADTNAPTGSPEGAPPSRGITFATSGASTPGRICAGAVSVVWWMGCLWLR